MFSLFTPTSLPSDMRPYHEIIPHLFLGNYQSPSLRRFDLVVNCTRDLPPPTYTTDVVRLAVNDHPNECPHLLSLIQETHVLERIHEHLVRGESVLVHCYAGMQRSCAVVACYLMRYNRWTPSMAMTYIQSKRPVAFFGGANFMDTIQQYYRLLTSLSSSSSSSLIQN